MSSANISSVAAEGFKDAASYDAHRPSYPAKAVEKLLRNLKVTDMDGASIIDIASGTGKFTEILARRTEGYTVKAVEPHERMRQVLEDKQLTGVEVLAGSAEGMPVEEEWGDACIAAQALHWFATPEALKEIHRVLRPGAVFGFIWNSPDYNKPQSWPATTKWEQKLNEYIWTFDDGQPRFRHLKWKDVFESQLPGTPFRVIKDTLTDHLPRFSLPLGEDKVTWTEWMSEDALVSRLCTLSQFAVLKGEEHEKALKVFKDVLAGDDVERNEKGEIAVHGLTYFGWTDRL